MRRDGTQGNDEQRKNLLLDLDFTLLEDQVLSSDALEDVVHIVDDSLEVGGGIIGASDEDAVRLARACWSVERCNRDEPMAR